MEVAGRGVLLAVLLVLVPRLAYAQDTQDAGPDAGPPAADAGPEFEPPHALAETTVPYPPGAPPQVDKIVVTVKLLVDATGTVQKVDVLTDPHPVFDDAVVAAARAFRFDPARYGGKPVPVEITFTHTFLPPPPPEPPPPPGDTGPVLDAVLRGRLVTMGTRVPVAGATVTALIDDRPYLTVADARGKFRLPVPSGSARISVNASGYNPFVQEETLAARQELAVTYYVERDRYDPYEIVVIGDQRREEVSRVSLRGPEIKQVPGTFGDPFRVVQALPGVASVMSLLPFPIVRGASPSSTGFLLDGTRVPLLYHLLYGPSVVHPDFIDEVQFYPGGAPVTYGGYTGGIIDGRTARARRDEHLIDADANLLQAGGLAREPVPFLDATLTVAARYGYPGFILGLATQEVSLSYWDYQFRLDGGNARNGWTLFAFGARDELLTVAPTADPNDPNPPLEPSLVLGFHRVDLRLHHGSGAWDGTYRVVAGYDETISAGADVSMFVLEPQLHWRWKPSDTWTFVAGLEGTFHDVSQGMNAAPADEVSLDTITRDIDKLYVGSGLTEMLWRPTPAWLIRPGVRADVYNDGTTTQSAADPRLTVRYKLAERELDDVPPGSDDSAIWLKGSLGIYHQPPRFVVPLPGLDTMPLKYGLLGSYQASLGAEVPLGNHFSATGEAFFNYMDPTIFDLTVNAQDLNNQANGSIFPDMTTPGPSTAQEVLDRLLQPNTGRAYGLELLVRRQARTGLFGWVSYTLSRAERMHDGAWVPYDFDRTHLLNVVAGLPLPRNWDIGFRLQYQSGKPATTTHGYNTARTDGYVRIDLRIDKRAVYRNWLFDFYVDVINVALMPEEITPGATIRYVLPSVGVRGRF